MNEFPAANLIATIVFVMCLMTLVIGALIAVLSTRLIRGVCGLAIACLGLAGLYFFLHSPFLALMEILIYIGAVCVTIVFAIMLAEPDEAAEERRKAGWLWAAVAVAVAATLFWGICGLAGHAHWTAPASRVNQGSIWDIGIALLTTYSMAFEMISLALLVAILGALAIARTGREKALS